MRNIPFFRTCCGHTVRAAYAGTTKMCPRVVARWLFRHNTPCHLQRTSAFRVCLKAELCLLTCTFLKLWALSDKTLPFLTYTLGSLSYGRFLKPFAVLQRDEVITHATRWRVGKCVWASKVGERAQEEWQVHSMSSGWRVEAGAPAYV